VKIQYDYEHWGIRIKAVVTTTRALPEGTTGDVLAQLEALHLRLRELAAEQHAANTEAKPA
jgi:hypothetical protein